MNEERLDILFQKRIKGELTIEEQEELTAAIENPEYRKALSLKLALHQYFSKENQQKKAEAKAYLTQLEAIAKDANTPTGGLTAARDASVRHKDGIINRLYTRKFWMRVAATLLLLVGLTWIALELTEKKNEFLASGEEKLTRQAISPGSTSENAKILGIEGTAPDEVDIPCGKYLFGSSRNFFQAINCLLTIKDELSPKAKAYYLGWAYLKREEPGDVEKAITHLEEALSLEAEPTDNIDNNEVKFNLLVAMILTKEKRYRTKIETYFSDLESVRKFEIGLKEIKSVYNNWIWRLNMKNKK